MVHPLLLLTLFYCVQVFLQFKTIDKFAEVFSKELSKSTKHQLFRCQIIFFFPSPRLWQPIASPPLKLFVVHVHMGKIFTPLQKKCCPYVLYRLYSDTYMYNIQHITKKRLDKAAEVTHLLDDDENHAVWAH